MSLVFGAATSDRVDCTNIGTDPTVFTIYGWVYPTTLTLDRKILSKLSSNLVLQLAAATSATRLRLAVAYSTTSMAVTTATGTMTTNEWQFIAVTGNHTTSVPRAYRGTLTVAPTEVTYVTQLTPVGTRTTDGGAIVILGNNVGAAQAFQGRIGVMNFINGTVLSLPELTRHWMQPHKHANSKLFMHLGFAGTGTQPDWSGNGNSGTVNGATVGAHVPLGPLFGWDAVSRYAVTAGGVVMVNPFSGRGGAAAWPLAA